MTVILEEGKSYLSEDAVADVRKLDKSTQSLVTQQLNMLPALDQLGGGRTITTLRSYRDLVLPNGYRVVYRRLKETEVKELEGERPTGPVYLVVAVEPPGSYRSRLSS